MESKSPEGDGKQLGSPIEDADVELGSIRITKNIAVDESMRKAESFGISLARRTSSSKGIVMERRVSGDGIVQVPRRESAKDVTIATTRRVSASIMPTGAESILNAPRTLTKSELKEEMSRQAEEMKYTEHMFSFDKIINFYKTDINPEKISASTGLTQEKASFLLKELGPNVLTPPPRVPLWLLFLLQFANFFMLLLIAASILCFIAYAISPSDPTNLYLGVLLIIVVFVTCYETFSQEAKSDELMEKFRALIPQACRVIRDKTMQNVKAEELVVGDIVYLNSGDKVPADCRVLEANGFKVDQSMITGESEPIESSVRAMDRNPLEAKNIIFNGSLAVDGSCFAVVIRTGDSTLIGSMVELTGDVGKAQSTLKADVQHFVLLVTYFALFQAIIIFIVGVIRGIDPFTAFVQGFIIIMVANVPQGLPSTITAALYIVANRMGAQNVFVKKLDIIETLGSCNMICTDKTGTLTQNIMTVAHLWVVGKKMQDEEALKMLSRVRKNPNEPHPAGYAPLRALLDVVCLNSRVKMEQKGDTTAPVGDATELGLYRYCERAVHKAVVNAYVEDYREHHSKLFEIPFNSANKWQLSIHDMGPMHFSGVDREPLDCTEMIMFKGAPDVLLSKCSRYMDEMGEIKKIDDAFTALYSTVYEDFGGEGERVLGFAMLPLTTPIKEELEDDPKYFEKIRRDYTATGPSRAQDLIFVGLVTLRDPPRKEVPQAVADCKSAGIKVVMVTGDHPITAAAIARNIGLIHYPTREVLAKTRGIPPEAVPEDDIKAVVIHGVKIPAMSTDDWATLVKKEEIVFARTSPEQKLLIVQKFTEAGNVVAMTGDGVNDSPALKQAAIGVAMGLNGSDVAREAADIVLLDDNFASIVIGVKEGRLLFANLKKSIAYTLAHLTPEVIPVLMWAFVGFPQAMGGILTLCIDLLTELAPASSFAFEVAESDIMKRPPRNPKTDKLVTVPLMFYSYFIAGAIETGVAYFVIYQVFKFYEITFTELATSNNKYFTLTPDGPFTNNNGRVYSEGDQKRILKTVQGSWFLAVVICQAVHVWCCKTQKMSVFTHGIFSTNKYMNYGVVIAVCLGIFVVYTPGIQYVTLSYNPMSIPMFFAALIAIVALFGYSELRKAFSRNYPTHWLNNILSW